MARRYRETDSTLVREDLARYRSTQPCTSCHGTRLKREARHVRVGEDDLARAIFQISHVTLGEAQHYFQTLQLSGAKGEIASKVVREIGLRPDVTGIILQLPLPKSLQKHQRRLLDCIDPAKDVDGLTAQNLGKLLTNDESGLRPATPTNIPLIGRLPLKNLWINAGHGTLGWTHGAGSGKAIAELISGRQPAMQFGFYGMDKPSAAWAALKHA